MAAETEMEGEVMSEHAVDGPAIADAIAVGHDHLMRVFQGGHQIVSLDLCRT
jgi:hypothetical protein